MWRNVAGTILFLPILVGLLVFLAMLFIGKLPMIFCERQRAVRYLPYVGLAYYGLVVPFVLVALGLAWWEIVVLAALFALAGGWLLPDPFTFALNPRKRRAVKRAIEYLEAGEGPRPIYGMVSVMYPCGGGTLWGMVGSGAKEVPYGPTSRCQQTKALA